MPRPADLLQTEPGLAVLRMAALLAEDDGALDEELLDAMAVHTLRGALRVTPGPAMWPELRRGLMARGPSRMLAALRLSGALGAVLPEVAALFGVPQLGADQRSVDIGLHTLNALAEAARGEAPLEVRFALLVMNVGKSDSPPEHLPVHYRHVERGGPRIEAICARLGVPAACRDLALLALAECERVHRVSEVRAGPVAAMLARLGAFDRPQRFEALLRCVPATTAPTAKASARSIRRPSCCTRRCVPAARWRAMPMTSSWRGRRRSRRRWGRSAGRRPARSEPTPRAPPWP